MRVGALGVRKPNRVKIMQGGRLVRSGAGWLRWGEGRRLTGPRASCGGDGADGLLCFPGRTGEAGMGLVLSLGTGKSGEAN